MKIKVYLLWIAVAVLTFVFGINIFSVGRYFQSFLSAGVQKTELVEPAKVGQLTVDDIIYPPRKIEQAETSITSMMEKTDDSEKESEYEFDGEGDYYIIGDLPKGFKDLDSLSITTNDYEKGTPENDYNDTAIPPEGSIFTKKEFKFVRINIASKQIAFVTEIKKGISYEFIGVFVKEEIKHTTDYGYEFTESVDLKGRLKKLRDGKKVAESKVRFELGGC